jgi:hypothetical protein
MAFWNALHTMKSRRRIGLRRPAERICRRILYPLETFAWITHLAGNAGFGPKTSIDRTAASGAKQTFDKSTM